MLGVSERCPASLNPGIKAVERAVAEVARLDTAILLIGERGTGKSTLAREIHERSLRAAQGYRDVFCGTWTPEGESFRNGGTLHLGELNLLNAPGQDLLLEMLRSGEPGLPRPISSTTRALAEDVQSGRFREDLFFRLNGVSLWMPPLRQRQEDIVPLAEHFLSIAAETFCRARPVLSTWAKQALQGHGWPGNFLELEAVMRSLVVLGDEEQALASLQQRQRPASTMEAVSLKQAGRAASREAERELILKVLTKMRWNRRKSAEFLQISYKALLYKLKQIGVEETTRL